MPRTGFCVTPYGHVFCPQSAVGGTIHAGSPTRQGEVLKSSLHRWGRGPQETLNLVH